jgi:hypothetical protein
MMLNPRLLARQHITDAGEEWLLTLHRMKDTLFEFEATLDPTDPEDRPIFKAMGPVLEDIELSMQKGWKFEPTRDHHTWWYRWNHCVCPKLDNDDMRGVPQRVYNLSCPHHGKDM